MRKMEFDDYFEEEGAESFSESQAVGNSSEENVRPTNKRRRNHTRMGEYPEDAEHESLKRLQWERHQQELKDAQRAREFTEFQKYQRMKERQERRERRHEMDADGVPGYPPPPTPEWNRRDRSFSQGRVHNDYREAPPGYRGAPPDFRGEYHVDFGGKENNKLIYKLGLGVLAVLAALFLFKGNSFFLVVALIFLIMTFMGGMRG